MKRVVMILVTLIFLVSPLWAANATLNFSWEQVIPSPNNLSGWTIYQSTTAGGPYTIFEDVPFASVLPSYTFSKTIVVSDNQVTTLYFVIVAKNSAGKVSSYSPEIIGVIDAFIPPQIPSNFKVITITVGP